MREQWIPIEITEQGFVPMKVGEQRRELNRKIIKTDSWAIKYNDAKFLPEPGRIPRVGVALQKRTKYE